MNHLGFNVVFIGAAMMAGVSTLFAYCYCGIIATGSYEKMADCVYECSWYELEAKYQKFIVLIMTNTQRPIYYHGFGLAVLRLETFIKVNSICY